MNLKDMKIGQVVTAVKVNRKSRAAGSNPHDGPNGTHEEDTRAPNPDRAEPIHKKSNTKGALKYTSSKIGKEDEVPRKGATMDAKTHETNMDGKHGKDWFSRMSAEDQKSYVTDHPNSKYAK